MPEDILFDLEGKIREFLDQLLNPNRLGLREGKAPEGRKPEPEKVETPQEPTPSEQAPTKEYVIYSPESRTEGRPHILEL